MKKIQTSNTDQIAKDLVEYITNARDAGKSVLLLLSGGSNIALAVNVIDQLQPNDTPLHVGLIDERYGPEGHSDSNWQQLIDAGLDTENVKTHPVLSDPMSHAQTSENYDTQLNELFNSVEVSIGLFGIGTDGHTAGLLPQCSIANSEKTVDFYTGPDYERISLTQRGIKRMTHLFIVAIGENKWPALQKMADGTDTDEIPARIFNDMSTATLYTDYKGDTL